MCIPLSLSLSLSLSVKYEQYMEHSSSTELKCGKHQTAKPGNRLKGDRRKLALEKEKRRRTDDGK
jgi:hypothetical protein